MQLAQSVIVLGTFVRDDLRHLDLGSLQQQGDAALGTTRALLAAGITPAAGNSTYVDLFAGFLLRWPARLDPALAGLALLLVLFAAWRRVPGDRSVIPVPGDRSSIPGPGDRSRPGPVLAAAAAALLLGPLLGAGGAALTLWLVGLASQPVLLWPAAPELPLLAAAAGASALATAGLGLVAARVGPRAQALGGWLVWSLLAVTAAWVMPGASILFIAPALLAGLGLALARTAGGAAGLATGLGGALAFALWVPLIATLVEALGLTPWLVGALVGFVWGVAAPCFTRARSPLVDGLALVAAVAGLLAARAPHFTVDAPGKLNLVHVQDLDAGAARFVLDAPDGVPPELSSGTAWDERPGALPWSARALPFAPAPLELPPFDAAEARSTYEKVCAQCHGLEDIDARPPTSADEVKTLILRMIAENGLEASRSDRLARGAADKIRQLRRPPLIPPAHHPERCNKRRMLALGNLDVSAAVPRQRQGGEGDIGVAGLGELERLADVFGKYETRTQRVKIGRAHV